MSVPSSPTKGFSVMGKPFDPSKAGVYGEQAWTNLAKSFDAPPLETFPPAPPAVK